MKPNKKQALKLLGLMCICKGGKMSCKTLANCTTGLAFSPPYDWTFGEEGIGNLIIEKKDGSRIIIPFSDIVKALEG